MATILSPGDLAIVQYNSSTTDSFTFVFARDIEAGTVVNFTDNGWLAAGGFRAGDPLDEGTVTYTAPTAITAGTVVTLTGLNLDVAGDQIIAYQGTQASPTILYLVDLADGNTTVAGDATDANTTALPPGLTLGQTAVAVGLDNAIYAGPIDGSPPQLFPLISNAANWTDSDGLPPSTPSPRYFYPPHLDLDANNSTSGGVDYRAEVTNDSTPVPISDIDSDIDDFDGVFITFAQININNQFPGDVLSVAGALPFGIFATPFDPFTGILSLYGFGSHSDYQTAIEQIRFSTDAPVGVTKSISVWVFDDFWWSNEAHAIFTVTSAAIPPHLDLDANNSNAGGADYTATFTNGGLAIPVADTDVSITDPDSTTIQSARITIDINRQPGDALIAGALPPGITASLYNPFTGTITLSGAASRAAYQTALHQVAFDTTSISTADRIIRVTVNDGTADSNVATTYMHVVVPPPNVPPLLDLDANNSTTTGANYLTVFTDGGPAVAVVDADVSIIDIDSPNLASATVTLTNGQLLDNLTFNFPAPGSIIVFGSGTDQITLSGAASAADYQTALQQIRFNNSDTNPSTETRIVDIVVNDGVHNSNTAQALIQVEVVNNSAPVLDLDADDSSGSFQSNFRNAFTENGAPVPIADVDTSIDDADSTTLLSATIKLANPETGDLLTVSGVLPGAITTAGYDPGTGVLTLTGTGTRADYATALTQIRYSNTSDDPVAGDRLIEVVVSDGANDSNLAVAIISVTATNDAPVITVDPAAAYVENAAAVVLAPLAALSDADDTELNGALVTITAGSFPGDGDILSVGGATSNTVNGITFVWMPAQHALVFSGASSVANYQDLLRQVQFQSSSDNPTDFSHSPQRTLTWAVTDSASVTTATTTINIVAVNDAPEETVAATAAYTENGSPVTISPAATASDVDNTDLISGGVRIVAGGFDGDILTVNGLQSGTFTGPSGGQIDFLYDAGLQRLLFNNPAAVADYQALMQAVGFGSTSENPTNFGANPTRTLGWGLNDGEAYGFPTQTTQITITALNDAPVNTVPGAQSVAEDTILPIVGVSVADIDSTALTTTLSVLSGKLDVTAGGGAGVSGNGSASVTITGTAAQINAALVGLAYTGNLNFNGVDTLTVVTGDGTATDTDTIAITVNPVNDAPVLNLDANSSTTGGVDYLTAFTDGGPAVAIVDTDVLITDSDDIELTSATVTLTNPDTNDVLLFNGAPPAGIAASVYNPVTGILTLTGTASLAAYQAALQQITFANTGTNPSTETRIIDVVVNDGTVASNLAHAIVEVTQVNNSAPTLDLDGNDTTLPGTSYSTTFTENGPAVAIADTDTLIGDPDIGGAIASATITLTNPQTGDLLTATLPLPGGITASAYDPLTGTLTLSNVASFADYETALEAIRFSSPGDNPVAGTRIIQVTVNDGGNDSQPATSFVKVVAVNDAPVNTVPGGGQTVAEDTILPIAGVSVADSDSSALTTTLSVANGILNVTAGAGVSGNGSASVTIAGTAAQINAALAGLAYTGNLNFNGGDTLTVVTGDGTATDTDTIAITVTPVNDAPVNTVPAAQSVAEDAILPIAGVSVADIDSSALTTTLNVSSGILNVTAAGGVTGNGSASVSIAGTAAEINAALAGLTYAGNLNFNGADTLTVVTNDGTATDTDTIAITVNPVNDAPVNTVPGPQSVAEDAILPIAGVSVADIDSSALTTTLSVANGILNVIPGAGVTGNGSASVSITGTAAEINAALVGLAYTGSPDFNGADTLTVATNDGAAIDTDTIAITVTALNDAPINTVPAAQSVAEDTILPIAGVSVADIDSSALTTTLNVSSGILNVTAGAGVTGNGSASVSIAGTAAQINAALAGLAYTGNLNFNGADTLTVVTGDGTATDTDTIAITVNPVNDAPVLNLDANSSTTGGVDYLTAFTDGGPAVAIVDTDVLITDSDDIELASATVTLTNPDTNDVLLFNGAPPAGIAASVYNPVTGILTLTGTASLAAYQAALQQITFANTGTNPSTETRIIDVVVNDGTVASNLAHAIVEVTQVNNSAPTLDLDGNDTTLPGTSYSTTFTENGPAVAIADTDTLIGDPDIGGAIASATITLTNPQTGDLLTATLPLPGGITASAYDPLTGTLTLFNVASFADYETALEAIRFSSPGDNPVAGTRIIQVVVNDGIHNSQPATSHITVVAANDAPALVVADATYQEGAAPVLLSPSADLTDVDDTVLDFAAVEITGGSFPGDGDTLTVNGATSGTTVTGITFLWDPALHALVLTGASSVANYQALLQTVTFQSTSHNPDDFGASPQRTLTWFVSDGTAVTTATTTLDIVAHDDPAVAVPDAVATTENTLIRARAVAGNLFNNNGFGPDSDPDGGTFVVTAVSVGTVDTPITLPSGALLIVNADGTFNYDPNHMFDYLPAPGSGASNLTYVDTFAYAITGGDAATVTVTVSGVDSNDILYDSAASDTLAGGVGNDFYFVSNSSDVVIEAPNGGIDTVEATVNYTLPASNTVEVLYMFGSGLTGTGSGGPETLVSLNGPNTLVGLGGDDYYYVNNTADVVIEATNGGHDTVASTVNYTLPDNSNIELLSMLGSGLTGTGSSGADTLHSSSGPNTLVGLGGDDLYYVNNAGDVVIEAANGGFDTVAATLDYTLPANVEALYMYGSGLTATGSNGADTLYSSGGPNTLVGLGGDDFYYVNNTGDVVTEATNGGYDAVMAYVSYTLSTNVEAMYTSGSGLTGTGNSSANTLITLGDNTLVGGGGNDTFEFFAFSANGATVADFDRSEGDVLVFSGFGTEAQGATFTQIGSTDQWQIHSGLDPTHNETITFSNHAAPNAGDFFFV